MAARSSLVAALSCRVLFRDDAGARSYSQTFRFQVAAGAAPPQCVLSLQVGAAPFTAPLARTSGFQKYQLRAHAHRLPCPRDEGARASHRPQFIENSARVCTGFSTYYYRLIFRFLISTGFFTLDESCPSQVLHRERGPDGAPAAAGSGDTLLGSADVDLCSEFSAAAARPESPSTPGIT